MRSQGLQIITRLAADAIYIFVSVVKACWWVFFGGRQEADPRSECFTASPSHQRASQWAQGKTNYQRNDWSVRRASHSQPPPDGHN